MEGIEFDIVLSKQTLVVPKTLQQLALRKPATALDRGCRNALHPGSGTIGTGEFAVTFDLALLTQDARQHPLRLWSRQRRRSSSLQLGHRGAQPANMPLAAAEECEYVIRDV